MATSLTLSQISAAINYSFTNTTTFGISSSNSGAFSYSGSTTNGTGASAARYMYAATLTISASSSTNLDLAGTLTDLWGNTITFTKVKVIYVKNTTTTAATSIRVGGATSAGFANWIGSAGTFNTDAPYVSVRNGGAFLLACTDATGYAVTATTADILKITNDDSGASATVDVFIAGE